MKNFWGIVEKRSIVYNKIGIICCLVALTTGCNRVNEPAESDNATESQGVEELQTYTDPVESAEPRDTEADLPLESTQYSNIPFVYWDIID